MVNLVCLIQVSACQIPDMSSVWAIHGWVWSVFFRLHECFRNEYCGHSVRQFSMFIALARRFLIRAEPGFVSL
jgi:hypothetical protein